MPQFSFHIIAHTAQAEVEKLASDLAKVVSGAGHVVDRVIFTDDAGPRQVAVETSTNAPPATGPSAEEVATVSPVETSTTTTPVDDTTNYQTPGQAVPTPEPEATEPTPETETDVNTTTEAVTPNE